jgi:Fe-S cluster assembly protein SufD
LGGLLVRNDLRTVLAEGATCALNGLYSVSGRQHVDNHTVIEHAAPRSTSRELYKGVLDGRARAVFNGRVLVHPDAQQTDAQQTNNNLLLSDDAEVDTKPELEIYADDVKCAHGATVGQLDPNQLYYLRTRAVDDATARDLLTFAFANDVLRRFKLAPLRAELDRRLMARLLRGRVIREVELV